MTELHYTPDEDLKVHEEGAIRLICKAFQSHEDGLPEWLKNAADAYARTNSPEERRVIVVIIDHGRRNVPASISCLDFVGMTSLQIERDFRNWADPEAARRGVSGNDVQGGHGNGGKCYMTQMFDHYALLHAVQAGKGSKYGFTSGSVQVWYVTNRDAGRHYALDVFVTELRAA